MKEIRPFTLLALTAILSILVLVGCNQKDDTVSSVSLKDHVPDTAVEIAVGEFDCDAFTLVVAYESGRTEEIALTEDMLADTDLFKLYQVGDHEITVHYDDHTYTFKVSVKRATFGTLAFPADTVFTYDGKAHTVEVDGNIPATAVITYPSGNSFVNAGTYDVTAIVSCEGYVTERLTTTVTIKRATYDMSGVRFEGKEVVYDGGVHALAITGKLPAGVSSPTYTIGDKVTSSATDVGEYTVKATFSNHDPNYEAIPPMEATLKITQAEYIVKGVDLVFRNANGDLISDATKIYDGKSVTFDLDDYNKLSQKLSISYSVCDEDGTVLSTSNKSTGILNAGVYTVKVEFTLADGKNYKPITPLVRTFEILKAEYPPLENVEITAAQTTYDGNSHAIRMDGELPEGVSVSYEYYLDGVLVVDEEGKPVQAVVDAGRYTVKAVFSHTDVNYQEIAPLSATLQIEQATINVLMLGLEYSKTWVYDGAEKAVTITRCPEYLEARFEYYRGGELIVDADGASVTAVTEIGDYTVKVILTPTNNNYATVEPFEVTFSIVAPNE